MAAKPRIIILGAGFGGLFAALAAQRALRGRGEIILVDRNDYFLFSPLLPQIVSATLQPHHLARPLATLLPREVRFVQHEVRHVDLTRRTVEAGAGTLAYDFLVLALGSVPNFHGVPSIERHALPFKWLPHALALRTHIERRFADAERAPDRARDLLRTVIAGAGCTGVELITELHDWMRGPLRRQFPGVPPDAVSFTLAEALDHLLCPMDPGLMRAAVQQLLTRHIDLRLAAPIVDADDGSLTLRPRDEQPARIAAGTVVWTAGVRAHPVAADIDVQGAPGGRIRVLDTLQVPAHPEVLAVGDIAACPDGSNAILPMTAQVAMQQAPAVARTLAALIEGRQPKPFRFTRKGEIVGLGRTGALAEVYGLQLAGLPAWLLWRAVHLTRIPYWGDRVAVAWEWAKNTLGR
ncbi:MAG: NAD(P)/FAD-dependent oxidoreductase [Armatimonadota bacterium]